MLDISLWAVAAVTVGLHVFSAVLSLVRYFPQRRKPKPDEVLPQIAMIRPVCGVGAFEGEALATSFAQDYPSYEVLFCAENPNDPAVSLVKDLIAEHPESQAQLLVGAEHSAINPKINNMRKGYLASQANIIATTDSNLILPPHFLREMLSVLHSGVGMVSSPPVAIRAGDFWGAVECAFLNGNQLRWQLAADTLGFGHVHGKAVMFSREAIENGGGYDALSHELGADVAMQKLAMRQGLKVRLAPRPYEQPVGQRVFKEVWSRQLRWSRVRRAGYFPVFLIEVGQGPILPATALLGLVALGAVPGWSLMGLPLVWYGTEYLLARVAGWPRGPRDVAAMVVRDALLPCVWLASWRRRSVTWRGQTLDPR